MDIDQIYTQLLEADDQADRSVVLDDLRDYVTGIQTSNEELSTNTETLKEQNEKLKQRNGELFVRLDDKGLTEEKKEEKQQQQKHKEMSLEEKIMSTMFK